MKYSIIFMMLCALMGCAQQKDALPKVSGTAEPVNSPAIMEELTHAG